MDNKIKDWANIIKEVISISQEGLEEYIKGLIEKTYISIDTKINGANFARIYLQFLFFDSNKNEEGLTFSIDPTELWRQYFCRRDFQILGDYFNAPINFDYCTYENWAELKDAGIIDLMYQLVGADAIEYCNYFNQIINIDTMINSYEIYSTIVETLKTIPTGADLQEIINIFKENKDWIKDIENFNDIIK